MTRWIPLCVVLLLIGISSCHAPVTLPDVQAPAVIRDPWHAAKRILITSDVEDGVLVCVDLNDPNVSGPMCLLTVGELRAGYDRQRRAD